MKIATNTLVTIFVIGLLAMSAPTVSAMNHSVASVQQASHKMERVYRYHDLKLELRASVLDMDSEQLREELKISSFDQVIKRHGFKDRLSFHTAIIGKVKDELRHRGWSDKKIDRYLLKRTERLNKV